MATDRAVPRRRRTGLRRLAVVLASVGLLGATALAVPAPAARAATGDVQFTGHGWGHGRGLGQWGSYGYAINHGWSYAQILSHYYGGMVQSVQPDGVLTVELLGQGGKDLVVTSGRPFTVGGVLVGGGSAARVQARPDGTFVLSTSHGCASPVVWTTPITDTRVIPSADPGADLRAMLSLCTATGTVQYRGELSVVSAGGVQHTVNSLRMEDYLRGVVPRESPASWGDGGGGKGIEALKAQAVAARSYAWAESRAGYAKTCDTTSCQVYLGAGNNYNSLEDRRTDAAIAATAGVVLRTGSGAVVRAEFSASTGGHTAGGQFPAVPDDGDVVSPHHNWALAVPAGTIADAFGVGTLIEVRVTARNGHGAEGGRVTKVDVIGTGKTVTATGSQVRTKLGLKSDWFSVAGAPVPGGAPGGGVPPVQPTVFQAPAGQDVRAVPFGSPGDVPLACDWNGDGIDTLGVFRAGMVFTTDASGSGRAESTFGFGQRGDQPICGDWDGNGTETIGVYRAGMVYLRNSNSTGVADGRFPFGDRGDVLVTGNWDGDPFDTVGVWRRGTFFLANSNLRPVADAVIPYGAATDLPTVGDWNGDGRSTIGVFRAGTFLVRDSNTPGSADRVQAFGDPGDRPLPGSWVKGPLETVGVSRGY